MKVFDISGLYKRREHGDAVFELHVPALQFHSGRIYGIVGPSGSGKSTLLDMLALVLRPTAAERFVFQPDGSERADLFALWNEDAEEDLARLRRSQMGYVLQTGGLFSFLSVRKNLELPFHLSGLVPDHDRINGLAERFGIASQLPKKPAQLSGGQRQRVAILRALCLSPPLVLADEPTAAVDQARREQIAGEFRTLALEMGTTVIVVSHDLDLIEQISDQIIPLTVEKAVRGETISVCRQPATATAGEAAE